MNDAKRLLIIFFGVLLLVVMVISCSVRKTEPIRDPIDREDEAFINGQVLYMQHCQKCHPGGEGGLGSPINNNPAPVDVFRLQVRQGLGAMPAFGDDEISDEELSDILVYLRALRSN